MYPITEHFIDMATLIPATAVRTLRLKWGTALVIPVLAIAADAAGNNGTDLQATSFTRPDGPWLSMTLQPFTLFLAAGIVLAGFLAWAYAYRLRCRRKYTIQKKLLAEREKRNKEIIDRFFRNVSHEIRTPLNGIMGLTGLLKHSGLTEKQQEYANLISASSTNLLSVITDLLEFSMLDKPGKESHRCRFSIHEVLGEIGDAVFDKISHKRLSYNTYVDMKIPVYLNGDITRLRQILLTFLRNAIRHTEKGEIGISAELMRSFDREVEIKFRLTDTGPGFSTEEIKQLMEDPQEGSEANYLDYIDPDNRYKFSIARRILEGMGGRAAIESKPGNGSTIWFSLIFENAGNTDTRPEFDFTAMQQLRVLITDNNPASRAVFKQFLRHLQVSFEEADDQAAAMKSLVDAAQQGHYFHLAIVSFSNPEEAGVFIAEVNKNSSFPKPAIILITTSPEMTPVTGDSHPPADAVLRKPVAIGDLYQNLIRLAPEHLRQKTKAPGHVSEAGSLRILLAEDNIINEKVANATLTRLGHQVDVASNGLIAVQKFSEKTYDLIIMDIQMPEMDGLEATRQIRAMELKNPGRNPIKIVALTADAHPDDREKCLKAGMNDYITKPFRHEELEKILTFEHISKP